MHRFHTLLSLLALSLLVVACGVGDDASDDDYDADEEDAASSVSQELTDTGRRVCSWNIRRLGNNFENQPKDIATAAKIIKNNCDVVAVQETMITISQSGTNTGGYDSLLNALGRRYWDGVITSDPVPNPPTSSSEYYAFVFRKSAASTCPNSKVTKLADPEDVFIREPAFACFKLKSQPRELVVASYHALFGAPADRRREVSFLDDDLDRNGKPDDLFEAMKKSRPGGDPDVLLLGDFNLGAKELATALPNYIDLTNGNGSTINLSDQVTANQYDHAVVPKDSRLLTKTQPAVTLDVRPQSNNGGKFHSTVSDHLPIRLVLR